MPKEIITHHELQSIFYYIDGYLYWKKKPPVNRFNKTWNSRYSNKKAGRIGSNGYTYINIKLKNGSKKMMLAHRLIYLFLYKIFPKEIDHIDGNRSNNKIHNLREVTRTENCKNSKRRKDNKSGCTGVCWSKSMNKWSAEISVNKRHLKLGYRSDKFEAICLRKSAERLYRFHINHGRG